MQQPIFDDFNEEDYDVEYLDEVKTTTCPSTTDVVDDTPTVASSNLKEVIHNKYVMWTPKQIDLLLKTCEKYRDLIHKNKNLFFEKVHRSLIDLGAKKHNLNDIRQKFKNLIKAYKKHKEHENKSGRGRSRFKYGDIMDHIMEKSKTIVNDTKLGSGYECNPVPLEAAVPSTSTSIRQNSSSTSVNKTLSLIREVHKESLDEIKNFIKDENEKKLEAREKRHRERMEQMAEFLHLKHS